MSELLQKLQIISEQAHVDRISREEEERKSRHSENEARLSKRIEQIHALALDQAEKGKTWLMVSRLDFDTYGYKYWGHGDKDITPNELYGDDELLAEKLAGEGFGIYVGFVCPDDRAGDPPPGSVFNYFGITWKKSLEIKIAI